MIQGFGFAQASRLLGFGVQRFGGHRDFAG